MLSKVRKTVLIFAAYGMALSTVAQNKYGLKASTLVEYKASINVHPDKVLVDLEKFIPGIWRYPRLSEAESVAAPTNA